ncbi:MAG TPA: hypothetical protein VG245_06915 [Candidatus Dormibacteraeota bacterium]|jgi:hypothetical protein|nr:hypothetical protein [Candidatus Dormibacteraeota bacterium]
MLGSAYTPIYDASFWFASVLAATLLSAVGYIAPRAVYRERASALQRWLYAPFLAIAIASLLVLIVFAVRRGFSQ